MKKKNTHLICKKPEVFFFQIKKIKNFFKGMKYEKALQWKSIKIVKPEWLIECARKVRKYLLNYKLYLYVGLLC